MEFISNIFDASDLKKTRRNIIFVSFLIFLSKHGLKIESHSFFKDLFTKDTIYLVYGIAGLALLYLLSNFIMLLRIESYKFNEERSAEELAFKQKKEFSPDASEDEELKKIELKKLNYSLKFSGDVLLLSRINNIFTGIIWFLGFKHVGQALPKFMELFFSALFTSTP